MLLWKKAINHFGVADRGCDEQESHAVIKNYLEAGGNFLDCADIYTGDSAERIFGKYLPSYE